MVEILRRDFVLASIPHAGASAWRWFFRYAVKAKNLGGREDNLHFLSAVIFLASRFSEIADAMTLDASV